MEHKNTNDSLKKAISENRNFLNEQINRNRRYSIEEAKVMMRRLMQNLYNSTKWNITTKLDETIVNGSRVFIENSEVKTELNEYIKNTGRMSIEDAQKLTIDKVKKIYALSNENT